MKTMDQQSTYETPMMQQYSTIKKKYEDSILFFRMGDFYEMFLDDAQIGAQVLGITLTSRHKGKDGAIPMAGVPYHAAENYIRKLVNNGYKVAICEQISDPSAGADIVERDVVRVVTPSTMLSDDEDVHVDSFVMSFAINKKSIGISLVSTSTGTVYVVEELLPALALDDAVMSVVDEYVVRFKPAELLMLDDWYDNEDVRSHVFRRDVSPFRHSSTMKNGGHAEKHIKDFYAIDTLESFGIQNNPASALALSYALEYLSETQKQDMVHLKQPVWLQPEGSMHLTGQTIRNLELFSTMRSGQYDTSLYGVLNRTKTAMGARLLRNWLVQPLSNLEKLVQRQDVVDWFAKHSDVMEELRSLLSTIADVERHASRLSVGVGNGRDLASVGVSLSKTLEIRKVLAQADQADSDSADLAIIQLLDDSVNWDEIEEMFSLLQSGISDDPPVTLNEGGIIREGYNTELDELLRLNRDSQQFLDEMQAREREATGISSLKISFNKVFGYYIEVSKSNTDNVPHNYVRKQTLVNAERYITDELKEFEKKALDAEEKAYELEYQLFNEIKSRVVEKVKSLQDAAVYVATIDVLSAFALNSLEYNYVRPELTNNDQFDISQGRHPVVEQIQQQPFVPNDTKLSDESSMMVLTGANMAGKSTYIRQVALLAIMAQIGSFVPAESMTLGLLDKIHTRIGAMDDVAFGLSTFMVEMVEVANILNQITDRSLVILDELGRGTSTIDGVSIAWSVAERVLTESKAKTLIATHYVELTDLPDHFSQAKNYNMAVAEKGHDVVFLYHVKEGTSDHSYGIQVAKHAGLPKSVVSRARELHSDLQKQAKRLSPMKLKQLELFE